MSSAISNVRPDPDQLLVEIADYVANFTVQSSEAYSTARYCLMDTLGCGLLALHYPACTKLLGPTVPGMTVHNGARVPGTRFELDPVTAAFNIGCIIRWLDFNDTWLAAEWGHPSDNLGAILGVTDYISRQIASGASFTFAPTGRETRSEAVRKKPQNRRGASSSPAPGSEGEHSADIALHGEGRGEAARKKPFTMRDVLTAMIKAHEIQGVLALENSFNRVGLDHVLLVRIASTAVATQLLGGTRDQIINAVSNAWVDGGALRTYRHAPNTGSRKSWAAGDATSRAVTHALMALKGEMGYPSALSAKTWGFSDVLFKGQPIKLARPFSSYVMENVLFKISFPAEFHAQTAVEAAFQLHPEVKDRLDDIDQIVLNTHESAIRIIDKTGPLHNPADRDHCLQYMVAIGLLFGNLTADHYEDEIAHDPRVDALRAKMVVKETKRYSREYLEPDKRSIANAIQVFFKGGSSTEKIEVEYPVGHRRRRPEGIPLLVDKFKSALASRLPAHRVENILNICNDSARFEAMPVDEFIEHFVI